jgi:hypothetical protein
MTDYFYEPIMGKNTTKKKTSQKRKPPLTRLLYIMIKKSLEYAFHLSCFNINIDPAIGRV